MSKLLISGGTRIVRIRGLFAGLALAWLLGGGTVFAQTAADTQAASESSAAAQNSVKLTTVLMALPAGTPWLSLHIDTLLCIYNPVNRSWPGGREVQEVSPFLIPFKAELERAGYKVVSPEDNLFDHETGAADYEAAAVISDAHFEGCVSRGEYFTESGSVRGSGSMKIDWQLYSSLKRQVVARVSTSGATKLEKSVVGGVQRLVVDAFAANARELAANADFRAALSAPKPFTAGFQMPGQQSKIALSGSLKAGPRKIADAAGSVVTILTGTGSGSAFLFRQTALS